MSLCDQQEPYLKLFEWVSPVCWSKGSRYVQLSADDVEFGAWQRIRAFQSNICSHVYMGLVVKENRTHVRWSPRQCCVSYQCLGFLLSYVKGLYSLSTAAARVAWFTKG
jgi:hypothetical protein